MPAGAEWAWLEAYGLMEADPAAVHGADWAQARQAVEAPLEELIQACLAKNPAARPKDAQELARRLDALPLEQPWNEEQARAWWEANMEARREPGQLHDTEVDPMGRTEAEE